MRISVVGKILMTLIFASVIGGLSAGSALGDNDHRGRPKQQGRHDNRRWHDDRGYHRSYGNYRYRPMPFYAPPPVIYAPLPSPGVSIFFPPIHIQ